MVTEMLTCDRFAGADLLVTVLLYCRSSQANIGATTTQCDSSPCKRCYYCVVAIDVTIYN